MEAAPKLFIEQPELGCYSSSGQNKPSQPPGFYQPNQGHINTSNDYSLEAMLKEYIVKNEIVVQSQAVS